MTRYYARSASDNTDDWPFWFVADSQRDGLNVTATLLQRFTGSPFPPQARQTPRDLLGLEMASQPFLPPWDAVQLAMRANREGA